MRERDFNADFVELLFDAAVHFAPHHPLLNGNRLEAGLDHHRRVAELIDAQNLQRGQNERLVHFVLHQLIRHLLEDLDHVVGVFLVRDSDVEKVIRKLMRHVGKGRDGAIRKNVNRPVQAAEHNGPQIDLLHKAAGSVDDGHVIHPNLVFKQNKQARKQVAHQVLRAKAYGQAKNAGAGQKRADVKPGFLERHHERQKPYRDYNRLSKDAAQGGRALLHLDIGPAILLHPFDDLDPDGVNRLIHNLGGNIGRHQDRHDPDGMIYYDGGDFGK